MKKQSRKRIIGILGGMGPQASAHLLDLLIELSVKEFGAKNDNDFPEILLDSVSVPDFISNHAGENDALKILKERIKFLNKIQPLCLAIACNTAHILLEDLEMVSNAPFISIIDEVTNSVGRAGLKKVGILATPVTLKSGLYQNALAKFNIESVEPKDRELKILEIIIRNVIADLSSKKDKNLLVTIANKLINSGAEGIILGCTELPLIFSEEQKFPVFNSLEILAMSLLRKYYK